MTDEQIIELARRYDSLEPHFLMTEDTIIAFAQAVIEAQPKRDWLIERIRFLERQITEKKK